MATVILHFLIGAVYRAGFERVYKNTRIFTETKAIGKSAG